MKKAVAAVVAGLIIAGASSTPTFAAEVKVQKGDSLWKVSQAHNVSINNLKKENNLTTNVIFPGQVLKINEGTSSNTKEYKVVAGDTLSKIAKKKNVSVANLKSWNKLSSDLIVVGQVLTLNGSSNTASTAEVASTPSTTSTQTQAQPAQKQTKQAQPAQKQTKQTQPAQQTQTTKKAASTSSKSTAASSSSNSSSAKSWIAQRESGGSYSARNGRYVGKYQLDSSYLKGDYSAANQERVADNYVKSRYGSWDSAKAHWQSKGWY